MWEKKIACSGSGSEWEGRRGGIEGGGCARTALLNIWLALRISWSGERWAVCRLCRVAVATTGAACGVSSHSCARRSLNGRGSMRACAAASRSAVRPRHALRHSWLRRYHFTSLPPPPRRAAATAIKRVYRQLNAAPLLLLNCFIAARSTFFYLNKYKL